MNIQVPTANLVRTCEPARRRLRLGLALGSGAARGWAHIGVLDVLTRAGVRPDIVTGCSIGAVVGASYAAGRLDTLEAFALSLSKRRILGLLDFRLNGAGIIGGDRLRAQLHRELGDMLVEDLPIPFAAIATEVSTGHEVWMTKGSLVDALRASYALPGIIEPVESEGRTLIDGALVNPIPVTVARALGADVVLCVNLNNDSRVRGAVIRAHGGPAAPGIPAPPGWLSRITSRRRHDEEVGIRPIARAIRPAAVLMDAMNIAQDRIARSRLAGDPPDLMMAPRLSGIGLFEFHRAAETIAIGRAAAEKALPDILELLDLHGAVAPVDGR